MNPTRRQFAASALLLATSTRGAAMTDSPERDYPAPTFVPKFAKSAH